MKDDRRPLTQDLLEEKWGHKAYGHIRNWGLIVTGLVLIVVLGGLALYFVFGVQAPQHSG